MSQKWHGKAPVIVFTHPQNRKIRPAVDFLKAEYEHVRSELERILGVKISDLAIQEAINVYNENRRAMREFCDVAAQYPQIFTPVKRHDVIKARWFMDKAEHTPHSSAHRRRQERTGTAVEWQESRPFGHHGRTG